MLSSRRISQFCGAWPIVNNFLYVCHFLIDFFFFPFERSWRKQHICKTKAAGSDSGSGLRKQHNVDQYARLYQSFKRKCGSILVQPSQARPQGRSEADHSLFAIKENPCNLYKKFRREKGLKISCKAPGKYLHVADKVLHSVTLATLWIFTMLHP